MSLPWIKYARFPFMFDFYLFFFFFFEKKYTSYLARNVVGENEGGLLEDWLVLGAGLALAECVGKGGAANGGIDGRRTARRRRQDCVVSAAQGRAVCAHALR